jgi:hypothetical protein
MPPAVAGGASEVNVSTIGTADQFDGVTGFNAEGLADFQAVFDTHALDAGQSYQALLHTAGDEGFIFWRNRPAICLV